MWDIPTGTFDRLAPENSYLANREALTDALLQLVQAHRATRPPRAPGARKLATRCAYARALMAPATRAARTSSTGWAAAISAAMRRALCW
jgi:hypothetical protein